MPMIRKQLDFKLVWRVLIVICVVLQVVVNRSFYEFFQSNYISPSTAAIDHRNGSAVAVVTPSSIDNRISTSARQNDPATHRREEERQQETAVANFQESAWCPHATEEVCHRNHLCFTCRRRYLVIIATARSGSTTLMYMLGKLPGVRMGGENQGLLTELFNVTSDVGSRLKKYGNPAPYAWTHLPIEDGSYACVAQNFFTAVNPPCFLNRNANVDAQTIVGFKTIRFVKQFAIQYTRKSQRPYVQERIAELVRFTKETFPCAKFVLNRRSNVEQQVQSRFRITNIEDVDQEVKNVQAENELMEMVAGMFGIPNVTSSVASSKNAILLDMESWKSNVSEINQLIQWLGFPPGCQYDFLLEMNAKRLHDKSSNNSEYKLRNQKYVHEKSSCRTVDGKRAHKFNNQLGCIEYPDEDNSSIGILQKILKIKNWKLLKQPFSLQAITGTISSYGIGFLLCVGVVMMMMMMMMMMMIIIMIGYGRGGRLEINDTTFDRLNVRWMSL